MRKRPVRELSISEAIAKARTEAGFSQRELSARIHRANNYIQRIETGERVLTVSEFIRISYALGIDPAELIRSITD